MKIEHGAGTTEYGPGVLITLDADEVALAIHVYALAHDFVVRGPATVRVGGALCKPAQIYVDPSGFVIYEGQRWSGRGRPRAHPGHRWIGKHCEGPVDVRQLDACGQVPCHCLDCSAASTHGYVLVTPICGDCGAYPDCGGSEPCKPE